MSPTDPSEAQDQAAMDHLQGRVLMGHEEIAWTGRPHPTRTKLRDMPALFMGCLVVVGSAFFTYAAAMAGSWIALGGVLFMAIGASFARKPFRNRNRALNTYYAITNQRVIILTAEKGAFREVTLNPLEITDLAIKKVGHDMGDIQMRKRIVRTFSRRHDTVQEHTAVGFIDGLWGISGITEAERAMFKLTKKQAMNL